MKPLYHRLAALANRPASPEDAVNIIKNSPTLANLRKTHMEMYDYEPLPDDDDESQYELYIAWTQNLVNSLSDGGTWAIPRSGTLVTVYHSKKLAVFSTKRETLAEFFFKQLGFTVNHV